ncbi:MAG: hypothetical protein V4690_02725 [Patescibacteria group bacterium]
MKKFTVIISVLIILLLGGYYFYQSAAKEISEYHWTFCENGYSTYYKGVVDGGSTSYDLDGKELGSCTFWTEIEGGKCPNIGSKCKTETSVYKIFLKTKLNF